MANPPTPNIAEALLARAHSPATARALHTEKVVQRPLVLRPTSPDRTLNARARRQHDRLQRARARRKSNKPQPLSAKEKRALGVHAIPKAQQKYAIYEPLHQLWCKYMRGILRLDAGRTSIDVDGAGPVLASADYHGAKLTVARSRCVSRVGLAGFVVKDTKFAFELVTEDNELKVVPKEHTIFRFELSLEDQSAEGDGEAAEDNGRQRSVPPPLVFEIHGSRFESRAPDRANRKFKMHVSPDL